jgi:hypothetical protein
MAVNEKNQNHNPVQPSYLMNLPERSVPLHSDGHHCVHRPCYCHVSERNYVGGSLHLGGGLERAMINFILRF